MTSADAMPTRVAACDPVNITTAISSAVSMLRFFECMDHISGLDFNLHKRTAIEAHKHIEQGSLRAAEVVGSTLIAATCVTAECIAVQADVMMPLY